VALSHLKEEIHSAEGNLTVGPDGTTKFGKHYGAISISLLCVAKPSLSIPTKGLQTSC
jgi:hypothetical protein